MFIVFYYSEQFIANVTPCFGRAEQFWVLLVRRNKQQHQQQQQVLLPNIKKS